VVTEFFVDHHTSMDMGRPINDGLIFTIYLVTKFDLATEFGLLSNKM
jgi:hypothetical protein